MRNNSFGLLSSAMRSAAREKENDESTKQFGAIQGKLPYVFSSHSSCFGKSAFAVSAAIISEQTILRHLYSSDILSFRFASRKLRKIKSATNIIHLFNV